MNSLNRYSLIKNKFPREILLLVGSGCFWKKCSFCDYHKDVSDDAYNINKREISKITGKTGVLDIINSGSCFELGTMTILDILRKAQEKGIHTIWFESHWHYRAYLDDLRRIFSGINLKFRLGIETFDKDLRRSFNKGMPLEIEPEDVSKYFDGLCLLVGVKGQTEDMIKRDIEIASKNFEYFSINVFNENSTNFKRDEDLIDKFIKNIVPKIKYNPKIEILIDNRDLGVG